MGRRPVANAEKKIFKEIVALSKTHTVNKISTLDIAARMHLSETIIYSRFSSKKVLMKNAFFYCIEELDEFAPFRCLIDNKTEEYSFDEFKRLTYTLSEHPNESWYILGYLQSDYYEFADLEELDILQTLKLEGKLDDMPAKHVQIFVETYLKTLINLSLSTPRTDIDLKFAFGLMPRL